MENLAVKSERNVGANMVTLWHVKVAIGMDLSLGNISGENLVKNWLQNVGNFDFVLNKGKSESIFNYEIVWTLLQTNMSAGLLQFNSLGHDLSFPALGIIPRTGATGEIIPPFSPRFLGERF